MSQASNLPIPAQQLRQSLFEETDLNLNFLVLTLSSCMIASLGLLVNSSAVVIGAMIIAPLMMPLRGLALAFLDADGQMLRRSLVTLAVGTMVSTLVSGLVGGLFRVPSSSFSAEILARTEPTLADLAIALAAGGMSGFAKIRPRVSDALAGTAISVALMPPLCVVGIGLSQGDFRVSGGAFLLYMTNFLGITFACLLIFIWGGYATDFHRMRRALFWFVGMIGLLVVPLFLSLWNLIRQEQLQATIKKILERETITVGQNAEIIGLKVQWGTIWSNQPSNVIVDLRALNPISPEQVASVQRFLSRRLNQPFQIVFRVAEFEEIRANTSDERQPQDTSIGETFPSPALLPKRQINRDGVYPSPPAPYSTPKSTDEQFPLAEPKVSDPEPTLLP